MKRLWSAVAAFVLATTLLVSAAVPAFGADVKALTDANYVFRSDNALCSSTLFSLKERWALTNYHCIDDAIKVVDKKIVSPDGTVREVKKIVFDEITLSQPAYGPNGKVGELTLRAEILAFDKDKDLAVLRILSETNTLPGAAKIAPDGFKLAQGQVVWAVGNPIGLENTVTKGVVSHLFREIDLGGDEKAHYIQTDAAIAGGSSGGSLYSDDGYLIGVPSAGYRGAAMNFAIPFDIFKKFLRANGFASAWDDKAPSREEFLKAAEEKAKADKK